MLPTLEKLSKLWFFVHCFCVCGQPKLEIQIKGFGREEEGKKEDVLYSENMYSI